MIDGEFWSSEPCSRHSWPAPNALDMFWGKRCEAVSHTVLLPTSLDIWHYLGKGSTSQWAGDKRRR